MAQDEIIRLQKAEIEALIEENRQLKALLAAPGFVAPVEWHLTRSEARIFEFLTTRKMASHDHLLDLLYQNEPTGGADPEILKTFICRIRQKLRPFGIQIETYWGRGYGLVDFDKLAPQEAA